MYQPPFIKQEGFNTDSPAPNGPNNPPSPSAFDPSSFFGGTMFPDAFRSKYSENPQAIDFDETLASMMAESNPVSVNAEPNNGFHPSSHDTQSAASFDPPPMDLRFPNPSDGPQPSSFDVGHHHAFPDSYPSQHSHAHSHSQSVPMDGIHSGDVYYDPGSNDYRHFSPSAGISIARLITNNTIPSHLNTARPHTPGSSLASPVDSILSGAIIKKTSPPSPSRSRSRTRTSSKAAITGRIRGTRRKDSITSITSPPSPPLTTPASSVGSRPSAIVIPNATHHIHAAHPPSPLGLNLPTHPSTAPAAWYMPTPQQDLGYSVPNGVHPQSFGHSFGIGMQAPSTSSSTSPPQPDAAQKQAAILSEKRRRRRESHNAVERRRRDNINEKISELATLLPDFMLDSQTKDGDFNKVDSSFGNGISTSILMADEDGKESAGVKANKGMILRKSVDYIRHLQQLVHAHTTKNQELEDELAQYRSPSSSAGLNDSMSGILLGSGMLDNEMKPLVSAISLPLSPLTDEAAHADERSHDIHIDTSPSGGSGGSGGADDDEDEDGSGLRGRDRERSGRRFGMGSQPMDANESALSDEDGAAMEI